MKNQQGLSLSLEDFQQDIMHKRLKAGSWAWRSMAGCGLGRNNLSSGVSARLKHSNIGCSRHDFLLISCASKMRRQLFGWRAKKKGKEWCERTLIFMDQSHLHKTIEDVCLLTPGTFSIAGCIMVT
jgi:hypothetical protein